MDLFIPVLWFSFEMICSRKPFIKGGVRWQVPVILALRILRQENPTLRPVWATEQDIAEEKSNSKQQIKVESPWLFLVFVYRYQEIIYLHLKPDIFSRLWPFVLFWFFDLFLKTGSMWSWQALTSWRNFFPLLQVLLWLKAGATTPHLPTFTGNRTFLLAPWMAERRGEGNLNGF